MSRICARGAGPEVVNQFLKTTIQDLKLLPVLIFTTKQFQRHNGIYTCKKNEKSIHFNAYVNAVIILPVKHVSNFFF